MQENQKIPLFFLVSEKGFPSLMSLLLIKNMGVRWRYIFNEKKLSLRQSYNLLFEKFLLVNFTRSIRMSDEFRVMNSLDDLIHVRIDHWKLFTRHVLGDATRLRREGGRGGGR